MRPRILIVDDQQSILYFLRKTLESEGFDVVGAENGSEALAALQESAPDLALLDMRLPDMSGLDILREIRTRFPSVVPVMMTAFGDVESSVEAMKLGAHDYVNKPIRLEELLTILAVGMQKRVMGPAELHPRIDSQLVATPTMDPDVEWVLSANAEMHDVYERVRALGGADPAYVLIEGESGSGRSSLARLVHDNSPRAGREFQSIRCAAFDESELGQLLFGSATLAGLVADCAGGSLLLQGVENLSPRLQLRIMDLGERWPHEFPAPRILATTGVDLEKVAQRGELRPELLVRLRAARVSLPPLRRRREDVMAFAEHFLLSATRASGVPAPRLDEAARHCLVEYSWPGNLRELRSIMESAAALAGEGSIGIEHLPLRNGALAELQDVLEQIERAIESTIPPEGIPFESLLGKLERTLIEKAYDEAEGNQSQTAKLLNLNRDKLRYRMKNFQLL